MEGAQQRGPDLRLSLWAKLDTLRTTQSKGDFMTQTKIAVIGGSGIYDINGLEGAEWLTVESPWGPPSDAILTGTLDGVEMAFLPRHGRGHVHAPLYRSLPCQYRCAETARLHGCDQRLGLRVVP